MKWNEVETIRGRRIMERFCVINVKDKWNINEWERQDARAKKRAVVKG